MASNDIVILRSSFVHFIQAFNPGTTIQTRKPRTLRKDVVLRLVLALLKAVNQLIYGGNFDQHDHEIKLLLIAMSSVSICD